MDDCVPKDLSKSMKMGASGNADSAKIASLQERKKQIQEKLDKHHKELRKLCIDEAELTGQLPIEYPFEQGELPPTFRRRIGTSYALNKNLLNNLNNDEISDLEIEMHMLGNMAQAALGLANEASANKMAKKAHLQEYDAHMAKYKALENKLHDLKISPQQAQQPKHKKKPRPEREDSMSMNLNLSPTEPFAATPFRHSLRSLQYPSSHNAYHQQQQQHQQPVLQVKPRPASQRFVYHVPEGLDVVQQAYSHHSVNPVKVEPTFYKLSLDGYKQYEDKQESLDVAVSEGHYRSYTAQGSSRTLPHASRRSPQAHGYASYTHTMRATHNHSPGAVNTLTVSSSSSSSIKYYQQTQHVQHTQHLQHSRQYYDARVPHVPHNPLQLQPHQQYEHVMPSGGAVIATSSNAGLGGYWKQSENGEFWCNNTNSGGETTKDKRFGSLDRRKKRLQKKTPPVAMDVKTLPVPSYEEATRTLPTKTQAIAARRHENRQLVRTQSLGSVGGMLDESCQSDDSSCGSENTNSELLRKNKQKEWYETSLDGPPPPPQPLTPTSSLPPMRVRTHSHSHSIAPSIAPEDKYDYSTSPTPTVQSHHSAQLHPVYQPAQMPQHSPKAPSSIRVHSPQIPPPPPTMLHSPSTSKEIPAESNPSPRISLQHENREIFNNNMPKNCTVVQQAQWKPYHEETKPFEMSDFYKYSTKYKKKAEEVVAAPSPSSSTGSNRQSIGSSGFRNLPTLSNRTTDINVNTLCNTSLSSTTSCDSNPLSPHVADNFSAEMNAWYQKHEQADNNNATLV